MHLLRVVTAVSVLTLLYVTSMLAGASVQAPIQSVAMVDQSLFMGRWYQVARLPNRFQDGCAESYTDFSLRDDGQINVVNTCRNTKDGSLRQAKGLAWSADPANPGRLKVSFFWPLRSDYWIIGLGKEYQYSVIASPNRKYLWILSRSAAMNEDLYASIMKDVERQGFAISNICKAMPGNRGHGDSF